MANTNKTKAEILQELESIKGLLLEEDHIPILQTIDPDYPDEAAVSNAAGYNNPSVLPGQTSLFEDEFPQQLDRRSAGSDDNKISFTDKTPGPASHPTNHRPTLSNAIHTSVSRPLAKASGENPFLPKHIRERLHGNNPPPLFEYETAKKIVNSTKNIANKMNKPRQILVDEVVNSLMPQIEAELRHRLLAMSVEDLEKLLHEEDE